jgi:hypothetical protein
MRRTVLAGLLAFAVIATAPLLSAHLSGPSASVALAATAEPHPEIRAAIHALERAKGHLQKAAHDFGGHRVDAIAAIDKALEQLNLALKYDK